MNFGAGIRNVAIAAGFGVMSACTLAVSPPPKPEQAQIVQPNVSAGQTERITHYTRFENRQLARGLLRTDGGGPDTPFDMRDILDTFETLAFFDEYKRGAGYTKSHQTSTLARWETPVRMNLVLGDSLGRDAQIAISNDIGAYAARLSDITGHPIQRTKFNPNFDVIVGGLDDKAMIEAFLMARLDRTGPEAASIFKSMPLDVHCVVMAFSDQPDGSYSHAIAILRAEHPPLSRTACIHEELAQGLGLANDSPRARPSIFNDDDEFATLTAMDEVLLRILYDPRLKSGMTLDQARPILSQIGADLDRPNS